MGARSESSRSIPVASAKARCDGTTKVICDIILYTATPLIFLLRGDVFFSSSEIFGEEIFCAACYDGRVFWLSFFFLRFCFFVF